jgi:hypothetical protein
MTAKYISELVRDDYKDWDNCLVAFDAGTGTGKTTFVISILLPYVIQQGKTMLYLYNRNKLGDDIKAEAILYKDNSLLTIDSYQGIERDIENGISIPDYDYVVADEIHYFFTDAKMNDRTNLSYVFFMNQHKRTHNVMLCMSATGNVLFNGWEQSGLLDYRYKIPKNYSYVTAVHTFRDREHMVRAIHDIRTSRPDDKILVYVQRLTDLDWMYLEFGNDAKYLCSRKKGEKRVCYRPNETPCPVKARVDYDCIKDQTFDSHILFTTTVIDTGIDLKDRRLKHIFFNIMDIDTLIQAAGRKRSLDETDTCEFYFNAYDQRMVNAYKQKNWRELSLADDFLKDPKRYYNRVTSSKNKQGELFAESPILYHIQDKWDGTPQNANVIGHSTANIKPVLHYKYRLDNERYTKMADSSYIDVVLEEMGDNLAAKLTPMAVDQKSNMDLQNYLDAMIGKKIFRDEQKKLVNLCIAYGFRDETFGLKHLNRFLENSGMPYRINSKKEGSRKSMNVNKRYWFIERL